MKSKIENSSTIKGPLNLIIIKMRITTEQVTQTLSSMLACGAGLYGDPLARTRLVNSRDAHVVAEELRSLAGPPTNTNWPVTQLWWLEELKEAGTVQLWLEYTEAATAARQAELRKTLGLGSQEITLKLIDELEAEVLFSESLRRKAEELFPPQPREPEEALFRTTIEQGRSIVRIFTGTGRTGPVATPREVRRAGLQQEFLAQSRRPHTYLGRRRLDSWGSISIYSDDTLDQEEALNFNRFGHI